MKESSDKKKQQDDLQQWEKETFDPSLDKSPQREAEFTTLSDIPVKALYSPADLEDDGYDEELGYPGEYPYTRGVQPSMYRGRLWTMRQFSGFGSAEDTNKRYHYLLENGQTGLSVAFHMPTLMGYDSDHERSLGEVGVCGVAIDTLADMETCLKASH